MATVLYELFDTAFIVSEEEVRANTVITELLKDNVLLLPIDESLSVSEPPEDDGRNRSLNIADLVDYVGET